jgi:hypothetical protein
MKPIVLGTSVGGKHVHLNSDARKSTHVHVIGGSGKGKSKFLESLIRQDITNGQGVCVIDWHGELYHNVLRWMHCKDVGLFEDYRKVVLLNPSNPQFIGTFNPFFRPDLDPAALNAHAESLITTTLRAWGAKNADEMPTFERICRALFYFMLETGETLPNAIRLLEFSEKPFRDYALRTVTNPTAQATWRELGHIKRFDDWQGQTGSTKNRLTRFVGSSSVCRFMGLRRSDVNIAEIIGDQKIILVNLGESKYLPRESARLFAALLLREFFTSAMDRSNQESRYGIKPQPYALYLDEFQEYINDDMAAMLDQVRKGGIHMVLAHQHLGHFWDNPHLKKSVFTNARIRAVFGGLDYEDASAVANEMCLEELNTRQVKQAYYSHYTVHEEETRVIRSQSESDSWGLFSGSGSGSASGSAAGWSRGESFGSGEGIPGAPGADILAESWLTKMAGSSSNESGSSHSIESHSEMSGETTGGSRSQSETVVPFLKPILKEQLSSESEWSREEKLSKIAQVLKYQTERHCLVRVDALKTQPICVPFIYTPHVEPDSLDGYEVLLNQRAQYPTVTEVDKLLIEDQKQFGDRARMVSNRDVPALADTEEEFFE